MDLKRLTVFLRQEAVLVIACLLATVSAFFVPPDAGYLAYVDFRTLGILFCLMAVVAGMRRLGVFTLLSQKLLDRAQNIRQLALFLILLCFFSSMVITNDVSLLTFVPFTFILLEMTGEETERSWLIPIVVMQTVAANLGSMLTPLGNPQNLYLYGRAGIGLGEFVRLMLPYSVASLGLLLLWVMVRGSLKNSSIDIHFTQSIRLDGKKLSLYLVLFGISLLTVVRVLPYGVAVAAVLVSLLFTDRRALREVDYSLLITFAGFFVFIGNMGRIPAFRSFLEEIVSGREVWTAVLSAQIISNVPAALLLAEFTENLPHLIIGSNLGGLGTLIASMASLISYKLYAQRKGDKGQYVRYFTATNVLFLLALMGIYYWI